MGARDFGLVINQTQAATVDSIWCDVQDDAGLCIHAEWSGTVSGTFSVECRNDSALAGVPSTEVVLTNPAGSAGAHVFNVGNAQARFWRVRYTHVGGTGSLKVSVSRKVGL